MINIVNVNAKDNLPFFLQFLAIRSCQKWQEHVIAIFGENMLLPKMAIGNNNNNSQILAKVGNKMVTLSLYRILSHIFAIFGNILLPKVAKNGNSQSCQKWQMNIPGSRDTLTIPGEYRDEYVADTTLLSW